MTNLIVASIVSYIVTLVIVKGSIFDSARNWVRSILPSWFQVPGYPHFIDCRLCVCAWVSLVTVIVIGAPEHWLPVYGLSYFMATQER